MINIPEYNWDKLQPKDKVIRRIKKNNKSKRWNKIKHDRNVKKDLKKVKDKSIFNDQLNNLNHLKAISKEF